MNQSTLDITSSTIQRTSSQRATYILHSYPPVPGSKKWEPQNPGWNFELETNNHVSM
jgi:hypothetical protein